MRFAALLGVLVGRVGPRRGVGVCASCPGLVHQHASGMAEHHRQDGDGHCGDEDAGLVVESIESLGQLDPPLLSRLRDPPVEAWEEAAVSGSLC